MNAKKILLLFTVITFVLTGSAFPADQAAGATALVSAPVPLLENGKPVVLAVRFQVQRCYLSRLRRQRSEILYVRRHSTEL